MALSIYNRYPLSSPTGDSIPLDLVKPVGYDILVVNTVPWVGTHAIPDWETIWLNLVVDTEIIISYDPNPVDISTYKGDTILQPNILYNLIPLSGTFSAIATQAGASSNLRVNYMTIWDTLTTEAQLTNG